jgi:aspartate aminotransferase
MGPDFDALERALTPRTRGVLLNSPNNPTGYVWTRTEMERLAALAVKADLWILSDEIYRRLVYEGEPNTSPVQISSELRERTVIVDGASKAFAMTGYRIGFLAAPAPIAEAVATLHSQLTGSPNAVSQAAFERALQTEPPEVERMAAEFDRRRRFLLSALEELGLRTPRPRGAFYAFPDVSPWLDERGSTGFSEDLLESQALVVVPGAVFGADRHVRLVRDVDGKDRHRASAVARPRSLTTQAHPRALVAFGHGRGPSPRPGLGFFARVSEPKLDRNSLRVPSSL